LLARFQVTGAYPTLDCLHSYTQQFSELIEAVLPATVADSTLLPLHEAVKRLPGATKLFSGGAVAVLHHEIYNSRIIPASPFSGSWPRDPIALEKSPTSMATVSSQFL
jgi:hypothetical protein